MEEINKIRLTKFFKERFDANFNKLVEFKQEHGHVVVSKYYPDKVLFNWYYNVKRYYSAHLLPKDFVERLIEIGVVFEKARSPLYDNALEKNLTLLEQAIQNGEQVKCNHRYSFNGHRLGTFLVAISQANKKGKHLEVRKRIEEMGFNFEITARDYQTAIKRLTNKLRNDPNPKPRKVSYIQMFEKQLLPHRLKYASKQIREFNDVWFERFGTKRRWYKIDRVNRWNKFRYNTEKNPNGKWYASAADMGGNLWHYAYARRTGRVNMEPIIDRFTVEELYELYNEGFPLGNQLHLFSHLILKN